MIQGLSAVAEDVVRPAVSCLKDCDVVFVLPHLGHGGAQRVASLVANQWATQGLAVVLITTLNNKPDAHHLDPAVRRIRLSNLECGNAGRERSAFRRMFATMRRAVANAIQATSQRFADVWSDESMSGPRSSEAGFGNRIRFFIESFIPASSRSTEADFRILHFFYSFVSAPILLSGWCFRVVKNLLRKVVNAAVSIVVIYVCDAGLLPSNSIGAAEGSAKYHPGGNRQRLFLRLTRTLVGRRERYMRVLFEAAPPPRVISFLTKTNIITAFATWALPTHLVVSERNDPDLQRLEPIWEVLRSYAYRRANVVTSNSEGILRKMQRLCDPARLMLLPNPLLLSDSLTPQVARLPQFVIVARLVHQKAIDVLLAAFAKISASVPEWRLVIMGDGPLRDELGQLSVRLGIAERVTFHGHVTRPIEYLREAEVFVLPSRFEGMPNSLLEAMASGLPAIVSDASPGPLELVIDGETGLVVPVEDSDALALAMLRLAQDADYRLKLGAQAKSLVGRHEWVVVEKTWREALKLPVKENEPVYVEPVAQVINGGM